MSEQRFVYVSYIETTPEKLWQALTETTFVQQYWFGSQVKSDWLPGSQVEFMMHDGSLGISGTVLESDPPRRLAYTWQDEIYFREKNSREAASRVAFELESLGEVVKLTVIHDQFAAESAVLQRVSDGWPKVLSNLKSLLEESGRTLSIDAMLAIKAARSAANGAAASPPATASPAAQPDRLFVVYVGTEPEKLWQALTESEFTQQYFFGRRIESDWREGAPWKLWLPDGRLDSCGTVLESHPPHRLVLSWRVEWMEEYRNFPETRVEFQIDPLGDVSRLTISEFDHPGVSESYQEGRRKGWPMLLSGMKTLLETGRPLPEFATARATK
jgi:uncharacterized protein YndB with AHSA1/START domain